MISDHDLLTLCAMQEAVGEPDDGVAAIVRVCLNRARLHYNSDGTIADVIDRHDQFSWTTWVMTTTGYREVAIGMAAELARVQQLLVANQANHAHWARCSQIAQAVVAGSYRGAAYDHLTDDAVLYLNPRIVKRLPAWAVAANHVCAIGHHDFYRDPPRSGPAAAAQLAA